MGPKEVLLHRSHSILMVFHPILCYLSPKILIFQELLIIETWNLCHWIWHASNPKYMPLKPFWCIFFSQNEQKVKFLPEILIFQEPLIVETQNLHHWIWHASNPKHVPLKPFWCMFPSQNQQNVKSLAVCLTPPDKNMKKNSICTGTKVFRKAQKSAHMGFWVCWSQWTMLDLCVTSTFWVMMVFSWFVTGRCRYRVLKHGVGVQWDPRSTAA